MYGLGEKLKDRRTSLHITQAELSQDIGVSQQTISAIELGEVSPSLKTLWAILQTLNMKLIVGEDEKHGKA